MLMQILAHTPRWVFTLFVLLLWLGMRRLTPTRVRPARATLMPLTMLGLAVWGLYSASGDAPLAMLAWITTAALAAALALRRPQPTGMYYDAGSRELFLPGSVLPLLNMMSIFLTKYAVGIALALHPQLRHAPLFALDIAALYGVFSGLAAARVLRLWKLVLRDEQAARIHPATL